MKILRRHYPRRKQRGISRLLQDEFSIIPYFCTPQSGGVLDLQLE
jgi:hypothetical protein